MSAPLLAYSADLPIRVLAVIGAGALGAFVIAGVIQIAVKAMFGQKLPPWPVWGLRALGGIACLWIAGLWLFGGGGGGIGGTGGTGVGGSGWPREKEKERTSIEKSDKEKEKDGKGKADKPAGEMETIRVEVLGDAPLKKLAKGANFDMSKRYRLAGDMNLRTLDEVQKVIRNRREEKPPLKQLEVVLYLDSPERGRPQVASLVEWANDLDEQRGKLLITFSEKNTYAPVE
jgi:hypothetical protein